MGVKPIASANAQVTEAHNPGTEAKPVRIYVCHVIRLCRAGRSKNLSGGPLEVWIIQFALRTVAIEKHRGIPNLAQDLRQIEDGSRD